MLEPIPDAMALMLIGDNFLENHKYYLETSASGFRVICVNPETDESKAFQVRDTPKPRDEQEPIWDVDIDNEFNRKGSYIKIAVIGVLVVAIAVIVWIVR